MFDYAKYENATQKEIIHALNLTQRKSEKLNQIQSEIDKLDKTIDQEVYKLYNLTEEEIKIIENN